MLPVDLGEHPGACDFRRIRDSMPGIASFWQLTSPGCEPGSVCVSLHPSTRTQMWRSLGHSLVPGRHPFPGSILLACAHAWEGHSGHVAMVTQDGQPHARD